MEKDKTLIYSGNGNITVGGFVSLLNTLPKNKPLTLEMSDGSSEIYISAAYETDDDVILSIGL